MGTFLVTGAAGFIGSSLAKKLVDQNNTVVTVDNLTTGIKQNIPDKVIFYEGNCQDIKIIDKLEKLVLMILYMTFKQTPNLHFCYLS